MTLSNARASVDQLLTTLKQRLAEPGHNLMPLLSTMSRFGHYSLSNQFLIYAQRPSATRVLGFHGWRHAGYQVRKGEKGIAIYAPMRFRARDESTDSSTTDNTATTPRVGYRVAYVFDITQVESIEPSAAPTLDVPTIAALPCLDALKAFIASQGLALIHVPLAPGHFGGTDGRTITCALGLEPHIEFATLAHETTHALLHFGADKPDLTTRETEAEAVAYLLCAQLGLDGTELSVQYIRSYRGRPETLDASLARIRDTALRIGAAISATDATSTNPSDAG